MKTEQEFLTETQTGRIVIIHRRRERLHKLAQELYPGLKIDFISFAFDNLQDRYNISGRKIKRIQSLCRRLLMEEKEIIEKIFENNS